MDDQTPRLGLPLLATGQAQKELTHNEAITLLDAAVQAAVRAIGHDDPPASAEPGDCWIVGDAATGIWAGHERGIAVWTAGGWRFVTPRPGMRVWDMAAGQEARYDAAIGWISGRIAAAAIVIEGTRVLGPQMPAIAAPTAGTIVDAEARTAIAAILQALRGHGLIAG